jgi:2-succinyl-6-hydroxy-2,4-cyclohexadiene-1-carboxylate synthase
LIPGSLLALHGFLGHPDCFAGLQFDRQLEHVAVPPMLGHGPTSLPLGPDFTSEVQRLLAICEALPAPRRILGYSQGARVALGLLAARPDLFHSALLVAPQPGYVTSEERLARRAVEDRWIAEIEDDGVAVFVDRFSQLPLFGPPRPDDLHSRPHRYQHTADGLVAALLALGTSQMPNLWPSLPAIVCPVELWVGACDAKFDAIACEMARLLPDAHLVRFPAAHHNPILDAPEAAKERFSTWLAA